MKKFFLLLISSFLIFTSCSEFFESYGTSLTICFPGATGRAAIFTKDDAEFYTASLYKLNSSKRLINEEPETKESEEGAITFSSLEPGWYQLKVGAYKQIGEYIVPVAEIEDEKGIVFELKSGENKKLPVELKLNSNGLLYKIEDQVVELETEESQIQALPSIDGDSNLAKFCIRKNNGYSVQGSSCFFGFCCWN